VVEDGKQSTSGAITFQDVDLIDTHSLSQALTGGSASTTLPGFNPATQPPGTLALKLNEDNADTDNTGTVDWTFTIDNALAQQLSNDKATTQIYTVTIGDGHTGGTVTQDITVTITGTNDTPIVATADVTGGVTELHAGRQFERQRHDRVHRCDLTDTHSIEPTIVPRRGAGTLTASAPRIPRHGLGGVVT
jgi:VCBS repeat-containing protein